MAMMFAVADNKVTALEVLVAQLVDVATGWNITKEGYISYEETIEVIREHVTNYRIPDTIAAVLSDNGDISYFNIKRIINYEIEPEE